MGVVFLDVDGVLNFDAWTEDSIFGGIKPIVDLRHKINMFLRHGHVIRWLTCHHEDDSPNVNDDNCIALGGTKQIQELAGFDRDDIRFSHNHWMRIQARAAKLSRRCSCKSHGLRADLKDGFVKANGGQWVWIEDGLFESEDVKFMDKASRTHRFINTNPRKGLLWKQVFQALRILKGEKK